MDGSILHAGYNPHMVGHAILPIVCPIKEDDHAGGRCFCSRQPLISLLEPIDAIRAEGELRADTTVNVAALIGAPGDETSAPFHTGFESVPAPVGLPAFVAELRLGHGDDLLIDAHDELGKLCRIDVCSEGGIDGGDELFICLIRCEAAHQLTHEIRLKGKFIEGSRIKHLGLPHLLPVITGGGHGILDGIHGILHALELDEFLGGEVLFYHLLKLCGIEFNGTVEDGYDSHDGHHNDDNDAQDDPAHHLEYLFIGEKGYGNLFERRTHCGTHRPPAFPKMADL